MLTKKYAKSRPVCKVTFSLPMQAADSADEVRLLGDFNDWKYEEGTPMVAGENEYTATLELTTGRSYQFRYLINGRIWENDWEADEYIPSPFDGIYNSVVHLEEQPVKKAPAKNKKKPATVKATQAPKKKRPPKKAVAKDDLKKIEGIGPKIAQLLAEAGIEGYDALGKSRPAQLKKILEGAGNRYKMHDPATWPKQAKLAAKAEWEKLAKLQDELKGGRNS